MRRFEEMNDLLSSLQLFENTNLKNIHSDLEARFPLEEIVGVLKTGLNLYIQENYTGPSLLYSDKRHLSNEEETLKAVLIKLTNPACTEELSCEGEEPFVLIHCLPILWFTKEVTSYYLENTLISQDMRFKFILLKVQYLYFHQQSLPRERSHTLKIQFDHCVSLGEELISNTSLTICKEEKIHFYLLVGYLAQFYFEYNKAENVLKICSEILGIKCQFSGALGKRTKFQLEEKSQLFLKLERAAELQTVAPPPQTETKSLPKDVTLSSEVLLSNVAFSNGDSFVKSESTCEHGLLLALSDLHYGTHPNDGLRNEECLAFVELVLAGPSHSWSSLTEALFKRCSFEMSSPKKLERSLQQLEELSNQFQRDDDFSDNHRLFDFFFSRMPPIWQIQLELAQVLCDLACLRSALDYYLKWEQWTKIIDCYIKLGQKEQAEQLIRQRLELGETVDLLCSLGDVTKDIAHYESAWELSKHRSARAMRSMAMIYLFVKRDDQAAIECFEKSLAVNPLQEKTWFTFGCCCLHAAEYKKAEGAFKRCVNLEPDNFEAWCNCASALIKLGDKHTAFALLKESLKYSYDNWKIWDNLAALSVDIGEFSEAIYAYNRLLDVRDKHSDVDVLEILVRAVSDEKVLDRQGRPATALRQKLIDLFSRVVEKVTNETEIWRLFAILLHNQENPGPDTHQRCIQYLQKAQRCLTQNSAWDRQSESCKLVADKTLSLVNQQLEYSQDAAVLSASKLTLRNVITQIKKSHYNEYSNEYDSEELLEPLSKLQDLLNKVTEQQNSMSKGIHL